MASEHMTITVNGIPNCSHPNEQTNVGPTTTQINHFCPDCSQHWTTFPAPQAVVGEASWTLTAPDGRQFQGDSPMRCAQAELDSRVPASVQLARIFAAVDEEASEDDPYFGVQDEVYLTRAVCVMNDVLTDIAGWEDKALAEAIKSSKVDLCAMIECIRMRADDSYVPGSKPIDGEVFTPSPAPSAAPHQGADALREALTELVACKNLKDQISKFPSRWPFPTPETDEQEAIRQDYARRKPRAWDAARAALAQHQAPQQTAPQGQEHPR